MQRRRRCGIAALAALTLVAAASACIRDLGVPPGHPAGRAIAVNSAGEVVVRGAGGTGVAPEGYVLEPNGEWTQPGVDAPGLEVTEISYEAINDSGAVVGRLFLAHDNPTTPARGSDMQFVWDPQRGLREIGLNGGNRVNPVDIADDGSIAAEGIVGTALFSRGRGYLIDGATLGRVELGPLVFGGNSWAGAVNSRREVVGTSDGVYVVWAPPFYWPVALTPMVPGDHAYLQSIDINDSGEIVAAVSPPAAPEGQATEPRYGLYWDAQRRMTRLPAGFLPEAIGDDGTVAGAVWDQPIDPRRPQTSPRAATWTPGAAEVDVLTMDDDRPDSQATAVTGDRIVGWNAPAGAPWVEEDRPVRWTR